MGDVPFQQALANLSWGRAVVNIYTANYPEPADPMGCCNNAEVHPLSPLVHSSQLFLAPCLSAGVLVPLSGCLELTDSTIKGHPVAQILQQGHEVVTC